MWPRCVNSDEVPAQHPNLVHGFRIDSLQRRSYKFSRHRHHLGQGPRNDIYVRVSLVGIEILTTDARIVIASVDTYLRFAEAVNRLHLTENGTKLTELLEGS